MPALRKRFAVAGRADVAEKLQSTIEDWAVESSWKLTRENPFRDDQENLALAEKELGLGNAELEAIGRDVSHYEAFVQRNKPAALNDYWRKRLATLQRRHMALAEERDRGRSKSQKAIRGRMREGLSKDRRAVRRALLKRWRKELDQAYAEWELQQIAALREELLRQLTSWLELVQKLADLADDLSMEPGLLFDLSEGALTEQDIEVLQRWAEYISKDEGVRRLCDMMGRLRRAERSKREETIKLKKHINIEVPDIHSREEITGITLGRDIENALPQELALLADEDTSLLFDLKYVEGRLMCFDTQGRLTQEQEIEEEKKVQVSEEEEMGPIIICVDTSGSMQGPPEDIAKALTLYMATRAKRQERNCYLINFSRETAEFDLSGKMGMPQLMDFLKMSFHGGTDATPALSRAVEKVAEEDYQRADTLMISDFVMGGLPENLTKGIAAARKKKNRFYALCVGSDRIDKHLKVFDGEWVYDPSTRGIRKLYDLVEPLAND